MILFSFIIHPHCPLYPKPKTSFFNSISTTQFPTTSLHPKNHITSNQSYHDQSSLN